MILRTCSRFCVNDEQDTYVDGTRLNVNEDQSSEQDRRRKDLSKVKRIEGKDNRHRKRVDEISSQGHRDERHDRLRSL